MAHDHERTYNLTDLHSYCLAHGYRTEVERLELYLALQREQRTAEDLEASLAPIHPSFSTLTVYG